MCNPLGSPLSEAVVRMERNIETETAWPHLSLQMYRLDSARRREGMMRQAHARCPAALAPLCGRVLGPGVDELNVFNLPFIPLRGQTSQGDRRGRS